MTNNLERRIFEHKNKLVKGFTEKYNLNKLVYFEEFPTAKEAIEKEKRIKGWARRKKIALIEAKNKNWIDLSKENRSFVVPPQDDNNQE